MKTPGLLVIISLLAAVLPREALEIGHMLKAEAANPETAAQRNSLNAEATDTNRQVDIRFSFAGSVRRLTSLPDILKQGQSAIKERYGEEAIRGLEPKLIVNFSSDEPTIEYSLDLGIGSKGFLVRFGKDGKVKSVFATRVMD